MPRAPRLALQTAAIMTRVIIPRIKTYSAIVAPCLRLEIM
jgi:hypothetical protein